ncbi:hypothetical protein MPDQ_001394 [Monascus purpureus]|uniref:Processing of GAS1 and ALP protein 2 n=1 Tax=Monascus purpureus TaxID=5098 RepID=A0A507QS01_MONPU|nr:hypothetical protein MPDQ_001394 [Monascus purpureus]BDD62380.1 hypothetical protein MAP00_007348 [Monascus purpureus]
METVGAAEAGDVVADAVNEFFSLLFKGFAVGAKRLKDNMYASVADMTSQRWIRLAAVVIGYIMIRPYIDLGFRKWFDYDQRRKRAKEEAQRAAFGVSGDKKAKVSANSLRGTGKVLGEVENTDDELEEDEAKASGVPEWSGIARKRRKKYLKSLEKQTEKHAEELSEEQLLELLDWSESEDEKAGSKKSVSEKKDE